ncbi:MAG: DUF2589 domain-containing protein [Bacteroidota bacterium]
MADKENTLTNIAPASLEKISLSQALLAPLDALFKAQVHSARSFLNLVLQIGYPHIGVDDAGHSKEQAQDAKQMYIQHFRFKDENGKSVEVSIPALALIPVTPLSIDNANVKMSFQVEDIEKHVQLQASEVENMKRAGNQDVKYDESNRPWYLVSDPVSFKGTVTSGDPDTLISNKSSSTISIEVNITRQPLPAGLDKLLTSLSQATITTNLEK